MMPSNPAEFKIVITIDRKPLIYITKHNDKHLFLQVKP